MAKGKLHIDFYDGAVEIKHLPRTKRFKVQGWYDMFETLGTEYISEEKFLKAFGHLLQKD